MFALTESPLHKCFCCDSHPSTVFLSRRAAGQRLPTDVAGAEPLRESDAPLTLTSLPLGGNEHLRLLSSFFLGSGSRDRLHLPRYRVFLRQKPGGAEGPEPRWRDRGEDTGEHGLQAAGVSHVHVQQTCMGVFFFLESLGIS